MLFYSGAFLHLKKIISSIRWQALVIVVIAVAAMIAVRFAGEGGSEWTAGALALLLFAMINPIIGIFAEKWMKYTGLSFAALLLLHLPILAAASLLSTKSLGEIRETAMVYMAPIFYYPIMAAATGAARIGVQYFRNRNSTAGPAQGRQ